MIVVFLRTIILYIVVLIALRIMGKSELSKLSTFQLVVVFMIAELASIPIDSPTASLLSGVIAIFTLMFLEVLLSFISIRNEKFKNFINGKPSIIVDDGKINIKEMKRLRITVNDLFESLRIGNCPSLSDVRYAVMESNGELSIISNTQSQCLPCIVINDGIVYYENLRRLGSSEAALHDALKIRGIKSPEEVFVAFFDGNGQLHVYRSPSDNETFSQEVM